MSALFTRRGFIAGMSLGAVAAISAAREQSAQEQVPLDSELDSFIRTRMESAHIPGLSVAIIRDGKLASATGFGSANIAQQRQMRADTIINVGSVTKTVTCIAVMQLWEQKKFTLDGDVNTCLPFRVRNPAYPGEPLTFRQLLTHTSSIGDGPAYAKSYACGDSRVPLGQWLRNYLTAGGSLYNAQANFRPWKPGMQFEYSNVAYGLLGHLVETVSGMSYSDYLLKRVFPPLGMSRSRILLAGMDPQSHATPYTYANDGDLAAVELRDPAWKAPTDRRGGVQVPHCLYSFGTPPDGLARTSAVELSRLLRAFMNGGELEGQRVLQSQTVEQIFSDQHVPFAAIQSTTQVQGLTWRQYGGLGPGVVWGHGGGDPGISTLIAFRPQDRRGAVVLTNSNRGGAIASEIAQRVLTQ